MSKQEQEEKIDIQNIYGKICRSSVDSFLQEMQVREEGLTQEEANIRQSKLGKNEITHAKPKRWYNYLWESFASPFNLILLGISLVLLYIDVILPETPSYANLAVVISLIVISTFLEFFEVFKSNKAAEKLKSLVAIKTTVIRDGEKKQIFFVL